MTHRFNLATLVSEAALARPEAIAASCDQDTLTWAELDRRTGQLATVLRANGVRRGDRVGIYVHKSLESLVAVHGILRAGAAYVPIDPMAPAETMATIISDCGIATLVTHELRRAGVARVLPLVALTTIIGLDEPVLSGPERDSPTSASPDGDGRTGDSPSRTGPQGAAKEVTVISWATVDGAELAPPAHVLAEDLAYVMYTSGSTGTPKGIMHTHRSGLAYATMSAEIYGLGPDDRVANFSPLHFDMSTFEVLAGVSAGSRVVLIPEPFLRLPASLAAYIAEQGCTTLYTVPSLFQQLLTRGGLAEQDLSAVRWVLPAGEVFPAEPLRQLIDILPHARFSNVYGPAEVNQCTCYHFDRAPADDQPLPIGYPSPDAELAIIDDRDRPIGDGRQGQLLVRAATMMAGYWNRPDLDDKGILYRSGPGGISERWYRTGDIVSRAGVPVTDVDVDVEVDVQVDVQVEVDAAAAADINSEAQFDAGRVARDQCLLYFGRKDNQIKIRGNRIELEMVEAAVGSLDSVEQAVVGVRAEPGGDSRLIVRYVPAGDGQLDGWRQALATKLPMYALPSAFEPVEGFPLTPSGKIDRRTVRNQIAEGAEKPC